MSRTAMFALTISLTVLLAAPVQAEFYGMSDFDVQYTEDTSASPPQYWLEGFTFVDHNIPLEDLVLGESTGVVNVDGAGDITSIDDFDLNSFAPRNGATPPEFQTVNFGGSPTWQDTNGDGYDFFIFEAGRNDEFAVQAILPGSVLGQKVVVPASTWRPSTSGEPDIGLNRVPGPNNNQLIGGIAFKITDLLDENGDPLTNESVIEGLQFTSPGMDPSCVCAVVGSPAAFNPDPADNATIGDSRPVLTWSAGAGMASQKVYFSENLADVEGMADSAMFDQTTQTVAVVWGPGSAYPDGLPSGTYYWRVSTLKDDQTEAAGQVWSFSILPTTAHNPIPVDGAIFVGSDMDLSWNAGLDASMHYVYFGTDRDAVAGGTAQLTVATEPTLDPGTLQNNTTYYWRVDEFDGAALATGEIWSFTMQPAGNGGLQAEYFSNSTDLDSAVKVTRVDLNIDFNWNQDVPAPNINRELFSVRWRGEIEIPANDTYTFTTRSNDGSRIYVNDQFVVNDWGTHAARDTSGTIDLEAGTYPIVVEYMQDGANANIVVSWESSLIPKQAIPSVVLSPVVRAGLIAPANGAVDVSQNPRLSWSAATADALHDLYIGDDADTVAQATTTSGAIYRGQPDETSAVAENLEPGKTYYWRVDQIIAGDPQSPIKGNIWSFTTAPYLVLDDFENYTDLTPNRIFETWIDGWDNPSNGSTMGYAEPDFAAGEHFVEVGFVNGGLQSGPMQYDNSGTARFSEATLPITSHTDWTAAGVDTLMLAYRGTAPQGQFAYDTDKDRYTIDASGTGVDGTSDGLRFAYKKLTGDGVVMVRVDSLDNTSGWAVSGVMIRNTLDAGSVFVMCGVRAAGQAFMRWRTTTDSDLAGTAEEPPFPATIVMPHWVRLTRQGNSFTAEHSSDGATWEPIGNPQTVPMDQQVFVGLTVSANVGAANPATTTSRLSMPDITGTVDSAGPFETFIDVGMPINAPDDLYVIVEDIAGNTALVSNADNPTAVQSPVWKQWLIDLQMVADQGVNLTNIKNLTIGVGDKTASAPGGTGTLLRYRHAVYRRHRPA
ncbi:MAG: PA14 domain-containing protein [Planctomycetota bacterium]